MRQLLPALSLGACTTVLSYLALAFTPLVGLQQIAVFAATGIAVSFGTVVCWFPTLLPQAHPHAQQVPFLYGGADRLCTLWHRFRKPILVACGLAMVLCLPGWLSLRIDDRPQALNPLPQHLVAQDRLIRHIMNVPLHHTYLVVENETAEGALQRLENFHALLRTETDPPFVELGPVLTAFLPSVKQQQADLLAMRTLLDHRRDITEALAQLGFVEHTIHNLFQTIQHEPVSFLRPHVWLQHDASMGLRHLWLDHTARGTSILVPILQVNNMRKLQDVIADFDGLHYFDQVADFTRVFKRYRHQAMRLAGGAYLLIFALLLWRYGRRGYVLILPPLCAAFLTVCILGLLGQPFHLIHCLALLLILGMGVDHTIFVAESPPDAAPTTLLALTLSALTTLLSFGLLSLSQQAVLQAIGLTTLMGIAVALCLAPMARYGRPTR
jgi:predicted exporter